ncbi:hypothetical protein [Spirosoma jeollabukense]
MILFFSGISGEVQCNHVGYPIANYESAFELLTQLVAEGWILQEAVIIDGTGRIAIPVEAFDGQPIQAHISALQQEWQLILAPQSVPGKPPVKQRMNDWHAQMELYYDNMIGYLEKMISLIGVQQARMATYPNESVRIHVKDQYEKLLTSSRYMHEQAKKSRERNGTRLNKLKKGL